MIKIQSKYFSIEQICESGQCFRLEKEEGGRYSLVAFGEYLELEQDGEEITFHCTEEAYEQIWRRYFDLEEDYGLFLSAVPGEDEYLSRAARFGSGIRILRQELWEMIVSFIISQQNNIKRIRRCVRLLCERYGEQRISPEGKTYYTFPDAAALSPATDAELKECNLGYRSRYIINTCASVLSGEVDLEAINGMDYQTARQELMKLSGIGEKVAECVCLFALHFLEAFPVDTHIRQVLAAEYPQGFPFEAYPGYAGVIQQYIFYFDLRVPKSL